MKPRLLYLLLAVAAVYSCTPDGVSIDDLSNYTIAKVSCEASSHYLIADGVSELDLHVKLYAVTTDVDAEGNRFPVTYTDVYGNTQPQYFEIPEARWRDHKIKFFLGDTEITPPYTTMTVSSDNLKFRATVDDIKSTVSPAKQLALYPKLGAPTPAKLPDETPELETYYFEVTTREPYPMEARQIPVIFHIIESTHNQATQQDLDGNIVYSIIDKWNDIFGRKNSKAPNGTNVNIEFVPALKNANGATLAEPGINRIYLSESEYASFNTTTERHKYIWGLERLKVQDYNAYVTMNQANYTTAYNKEKAQIDGGIKRDSSAFVKHLPVDPAPRYFWNPDRYLNIWIGALLAPSGGNSEYMNYFPKLYPQDVYVPDQNGNDSLPQVLPDLLRPLLLQYTKAQIDLWKKNPYDFFLPLMTDPDRNSPILPANFDSKAQQVWQAGLAFDNVTITSRSTEVVRQMAYFLGLIPNTMRDDSGSWYPDPGTDKGSSWWDDGCDDTPVFNRWYSSGSYGGMESSSRGPYTRKYTLEPPYYVYSSDNIVERDTYPAHITPDQAARINWVLENAVGRQMWRDLTAIQK